MFNNILGTSTHELQLSILEALFIFKKYKSEFYIQKQFYTPLFFNNLGPSEENTISSRTLLAHSNFFFNVFLHPSRIFLWIPSYAYFL